MAKFTVKTGFGCFKDASGEIIAKAELSPGKHPLADGYSYIEVASKEELDLIEVYIPPPSVEVVKEQKIQAEIRAMAEERLLERGELEV